VRSLSSFPLLTSFLLHLLHRLLHPLLFRLIIRRHTLRILLHLIHLVLQLTRLLLQLLPPFRILLLGSFHHLVLDGLQLRLVESDLLAEFSVDDLTGGSIDDILVFIDQLSLDLESDGVVLHNASDDIVCGLGGVVVAGELGTFVEDWFEKVRGEPLLASFPDIF